MVKAILFDLDGTLLPMDLHAFQKKSSELFAHKMTAYGYEFSEILKATWEATAAMAKNDGSKTNEEAYVEKMFEIYGERIKDDYRIFLEFYEKDFEPVREVCGYNPQAEKAVTELKNRGYKLVLATNPWFPSCAIESRIGWAGIDPSVFEFYTTFDNCSYCKPNLGYYREVLNRLGVSPQECLMVGNDVTEDMAAEELGMKVFLMTDDLINKSDKDITKYPQGGFKELLEYIESL